MKFNLCYLFYGCLTGALFYFYKDADVIYYLFMVVCLMPFLIFITYSLVYENLIKNNRNIKKNYTYITIEKVMMINICILFFSIVMTPLIIEVVHADDVIVRILSLSASLLILVLIVIVILRGRKLAN